MEPASAYGRTQSRRALHDQRRSSETAARQYEAAARDEIEVAVARANATSHFNMSAGVQELDSLGGQDLSATELLSQNPSEANELTRRDEHVHHLQVEFYVSTLRAEGHTACLREINPVSQGTQASTSPDISRILRRETTLQSELQGLSWTILQRRKI